MSKLEREIRKTKTPYKCFECKKELSVDKTKCVECGLVTLYGSRKKKFWLIIPILLTWLFMLSKFMKTGMF